jgi:hypothetical protein
VLLKQVKNLSSTANVHCVRVWSKSGGELLKQDMKLE